MSVLTPSRLHVGIRPQWFAAFAALVFFAGLPARAQSNYLPGYVVTAAGDTLRGVVNDRSETRNAHGCSFKSSAQATPEQYKPDQLLGYGLSDGKMYEAKKIPADSTQPEPVFMEVLVKGDLSLYHLKAGNRYFVQKRLLALEELVKLEQKVQKGYSWYVVQQHLYRNTLQALTADCPRLQSKINRLPFANDQLISLVHSYNACTNAAPSLRTARKFITVKTGLVAGANQSRMRFRNSDPQYDYLARASLATKVQPFAGVFLQSTIPWVTERLTLWCEMQYSQDQYTSFHEYEVVTRYTALVTTYREDLLITRRYLRFPVLLGYTYPKGPVRPYLQAGCRLDAAFNNSSKAVVERTSATRVVAQTHPAPHMNNLEAGILAGAGLELRLGGRYRLLAGARAFLGEGFVKSEHLAEGYTSRTSGWSFELGFGF